MLYLKLVKLMAFRMTFRGDKELMRKLNRMSKMKEAKEIVKDNTTQLQEKMMNNAVFKGHKRGNRFIKPTGKTKGSISISFENGGLTGFVEPKTKYSPYLEFGTRYMSAQPFVGISFHQQVKTFYKDMHNLVK